MRGWTKTNWHRRSFVCSNPWNFINFYQKIFVLVVICSGMFVIFVSNFLILELWTYSEDIIVSIIKKPPPSSYFSSMLILFPRNNGHFHQMVQINKLHNKDTTTKLSEIRHWIQRYVYIHQPFQLIVLTMRKYSRRKK